MSKSIGIGFLGGGPVTQAIHLPAIATLGESFRTVRVMDVNPVVANEVAARYGAIGSTHAAPIYEDPAVEVVAICSPNAFHAEQVMASCRAGKKAVLCEKPLAVSKEEAAAIREAALKSGTAIFVGTMHAYDPAYVEARDAWRQTGDSAIQVRNAIFLPTNDVYTDQATELVPVPAPQRQSGLLDVSIKKTMMRGAMLGLAIHDIPLVRDFHPNMGQLKSASFLPPFGYSLVSEAEDSTAELTGLMPGVWPPKWTFEVVGRSHRWYAEMPPSYVMAGSARIELSGSSGTRVFQSGTNGYQKLWQAVSDTVRHGAPPPIPLETAIDDLAFALDLADGIDHLLEKAA
ncbi:MAG: Gfo/Idh/MocA family oxidoreductase [Devosia sp.]|nr:Gfo/Idh/MocA family oxidoreductase [Devosia sp.]